MQAAAVKAINKLDLTEYCAIFVGDYVGGQDLPTLLVEAWDLDELDQNYATFLADNAHWSDARFSSVEGQEAFVTYLGILDRWRKLPFRDPGLPREVLPDSWNGPAATARFEQLVEALEEPAFAHVARYWPAT
jgi:phenylacetic acid degradation operon negative regulatory protein